ncbi:MAG: hypothetical protein D6739_05580 [Nitrospirae bacterium]|nr:MAG: hypothetical protein D6739_05580 [Nitrospirota bacterium]
MRNEILALARELAGDDFHRFVERIHFDGEIGWRIEPPRNPSFERILELTEPRARLLERRLPHVRPHHLVTVNGPDDL